ncbi:unnamed protein product [Rotaria sp. Silwood2]|nr:unnamed protein product [Rotaria sp. Silwood2]CAF4113426.1 unnamed protein product [Rotaria sp. Silwood2]
MAPFNIKTEVVTYLITHYKIQETNANTIYNEAFELYHHLQTLVDFAPLQSIDDKILSALVPIIQENFELNDSNK